MNGLPCEKPRSASAHRTTSLGAVPVTGNTNVSVLSEIETVLCGSMGDGGAFRCDMPVIAGPAARPATPARATDDGRCKNGTVISVVPVSHTICVQCGEDG